jgi:hypothetical protein
MLRAFSHDPEKWFSGFPIRSCAYQRVDFEVSARRVQQQSGSWA